MDVHVNKTLLAALFLGMVSQVQAADVTTNLGVLPLAPSVSSGTITHLGADGFTDTFNFSMPTSGLSALLADFEITFDVDNLYDINSLTANLYNGSNASGSWIASLAGSGTDLVNDSFGLTAGSNYSIRVVGTPIGTQGGMYAYAFTAAVPEAETYTMMLAGLGLIGFMARRARKTV
jgi:hypothetical protein